MDAGHLAQLLLYGLIALVLVRSIITTLDRAETGFTGLFVPPDRTLGWPRGVQEIDEPWAWRAAAPPNPELGMPRDLDAGDRTSMELFAAARSGSFVVAVGRVAPVRFRFRSN